MCHQMLNDMHQLCQFYVKREKINATYKDSFTNDPNTSNQLDEYSSRFENKRGTGGNGSSRNRSFSNYLNRQTDAYSGLGFDGSSAGHAKSMLSAHSKQERQASLGANNFTNLSQASSV